MFLNFMKFYYQMSWGLCWKFSFPDFQMKLEIKLDRLFVMIWEVSQLKGADGSFCWIFSWILYLQSMFWWQIFTPSIPHNLDIVYMLFSNQLINLLLFHHTQGSISQFHLKWKSLYMTKQFSHNTVTNLCWKNIMGKRI